MGDITLLEFQQLGLERLKVLKAVEQVKDRFPRETEAQNNELAKVRKQLLCKERSTDKLSYQQSLIYQ